MASDVDVANFALTLLGEARIMSLDDDVKPARELKAIYAITRDAMIGAYSWSFSKARASLAPLSSVPAFGYGQQFQMPNECLRLMRVGDYFVGVDLSDYRTMPGEEFTIEGRMILTDLGAPLHIVFGQRVIDSTQWHACFVQAFAGRLAAEACEAITQSDQKRARGEAAEARWVKEAIKANAIELPPQHLADDEWLISRL